MPVKAKFTKLLSAVLCLCIAVGIVALVRTELHGSASPPILYYNDRSWSLSARYPVETDSEGVYYIPLTVFVQLPSVDVRINEMLQTFIITHGTKYLSFDTATGYAANQDKQRMPVATYERQGERYVPVEAVCAQLGLGFEKEVSPVDGQTAIQITDGHQEYSLKTLLRRKHPGFYPEATSAAVQTQVTEAITERPTLSERTVYITVEDSPGKYTADILAVLKEYGVRATFFVVGDYISQDPAALSEIAAGGHAVALHSMSHDMTKLSDASAVLADIEAQNDLIYKVIKQKSHVWRAPGGSAGGVSDQVAETLLAEGYLICDGNVDVPARYGSASAAQSAINGIWANESAVLCFHEGAYTASALRKVLDYINENGDVIEVRTVSPAFYSDFGE